MFTNWNTYRSMLLKNMNERTRRQLLLRFTVMNAKYRLNLNPG